MEFSASEISITSASDTNVENVIVGLCVVGFHHSKGNDVEWWSENCTLSEEDKAKISVELAFAAVPEQAHLFEKDYTFCVLTNGLFVVSCFQQMHVSQLKCEPTADVSRSSIQKSVCILATKPLFRTIYEVLNPCTQLYFTQGDFSKRSILNDAYSWLTQKMNVKAQLSADTLYFGLTTKDLLRTAGRATMTLVKLFMLEKKVIYYGVPTGNVCDTLLSLVSLVPGCMEKLARVQMGDKDSELGLPFDLLDESRHFNAYLSLQQVDFIMKQTAWTVGTTNQVLAKPNNILSPDAIITVINDPPGIQIWWKDPLLAKVTQSSPADRVFIDKLIAKCENHNAEFEGSHDDVRLGFHFYLKSLLNTLIKTGNEINEDTAQFNNLWVSQFMETKCYSTWREHVTQTTSDPDMTGHPNAGETADILDTVNSEIQKGVGRVSEMGSSLLTQVGKWRENLSERLENRQVAQAAKASNQTPPDTDVVEDQNQPDPQEAKAKPVEQLISDVRQRISSFGMRFFTRPATPPAAVNPEDKTVGAATTVAEKEDSDTVSKAQPEPATDTTESTNNFSPSDATPSDNGPLTSE